MREPIKIRYPKIISSEKYLIWQTEILKKIYSDFFMLNVENREYPVVCFRPKTHKNEFNTITTSYDLLTDMEVLDIKKTLCKNYEDIISPYIHYKDELAYMFHSAKINDQNELEWFSTKVADYEQNIFTSNILEYELYKYFRETRGIVPNVSREEMLNHLPLRKAIHKNHTQFHVVTHGDGRNAGISIQMFYTFIDKKENSYMTTMAKIPNNVANKQNRFQFVPEGGYRLRNKTLVDNEGLFLNYNLERACHRILLEQIYGHKEIHSRDNLIVNPNDNVIINRISRNLINENAYFDMLGMTMDLVNLRPTISFLLRVDEDNFPFTEDLSNNNKEMNIKKIRLGEVRNFLKENRVSNESAGMYSLLQHNKHFQHINIENE